MYLMFLMRITHVKFKFLGTKIYISFLFCAVLCLMLAVDRTGLIIPTLFAVFIHESGHLLAMWAADCQPKEIKLIPTSVQIIRNFTEKPHGEAIITLCGPLANFVIFIVLFINYSIFKNEQTLLFAIINLVMGLYNMLPVSQLDGGDLLVYLLCRKFDIYKSESIVRIITVIFALLIFLFGVYLWVSKTFNISVFVFALYLFLCGLIKK